MCSLIHFLYLLLTLGLAWFWKRVMRQKWRDATIIRAVRWGFTGTYVLVVSWLLRHPRVRRRSSTNVVSYHMGVVLGLWDDDIVVWHVVRWLLVKQKWILVKHVFRALIVLLPWVENISLCYCRTSVFKWVPSPLTAIESLCHDWQL